MTQSNHYPYKDKKHIFDDRAQRIKSRYERIFLKTI
jgi:hypothetical protein